MLVLAACKTVKYESISAPVNMPQYSYGYLKVNVNRPLTRVYDAAKGAYKDLGIKIGKATADKLTGVVSGDLANGETATTDLTALTGKLTAVSIRVGAMGNRRFSDRIYARIRKNLK